MSSSGSVELCGQTFWMVVLSGVMSENVTDTRGLLNLHSAAYLFLLLHLAAAHLEVCCTAELHW